MPAARAVEEPRKPRRLRDGVGGSDQGEVTGARIRHGAGNGERWGEPSEVIGNRVSYVLQGFLESQAERREITRTTGTTRIPGTSKNPTPVLLTLHKITATNKNTNAPKTCGH